MSDSDGQNPRCRDKLRCKHFLLLHYLAVSLLGFLVYSLVKTPQWIKRFEKRFLRKLTEFFQS